MAREIYKTWEGPDGKAYEVYYNEEERCFEFEFRGKTIYSHGYLSLIEEFLDEIRMGEVEWTPVIIGYPSAFHDGAHCYNIEDILSKGILRLFIGVSKEKGTKKYRRASRHEYRKIKPSELGNQEPSEEIYIGEEDEYISNWEGGPVEIPWDNRRWRNYKKLVDFVGSLRDGMEGILKNERALIDLLDHDDAVEAIRFINEKSKEGSNG